jgi:hypothetical protein
MGYRMRRWDVALDIENLFNGAFRSAQFDTVSRLRTDPAIGTTVPSGFCGANGRVANTPNGYQVTGTAPPATVPFYGCEGVDFTPAYPFTLRLLATLYID